MQVAGGAWQRNATWKAGESSPGASTAVGTGSIATWPGNGLKPAEVSTKGK